MLQETKHINKKKKESSEYKTQQQHPLMTTHSRKKKFEESLEETAPTVVPTTATPPSPTEENIVAPFLKSLYAMLKQSEEGKHNAIIRWLPCGEAFEILDADLFAAEIIPQYFRHGKYASFQRQLNYFGFKKWSKNKTNYITYSQPDFSRDDTSRMCYIHRKASLSGNTSPQQNSPDEISKEPRRKKCKTCQSASTKKQVVPITVSTVKTRSNVTTRKKSNNLVVNTKVVEIPKKKKIVSTPPKSRHRGGGVAAELPAFMSSEYSISPSVKGCSRHTDDEVEVLPSYTESAEAFQYWQESSDKTTSSENVDKNNTKPSESCDNNTSKEAVPADFVADNDWVDDVDYLYKTSPKHTSSTTATDTNSRNESVSLLDLFSNDDEERQELEIPDSSIYYPESTSTVEFIVATTPKGKKNDKDLMSILSKNFDTIEDSNASTPPHHAAA